ncbi:hypothetical protein [Maridesulfovibrio hydrothermalis]|uniref:Apea-like HEPN domain-containing protein n=1 Tax=Maridesulfovibrio hydrothermalis AM13 = DSM 14728 TaxID=1121451 RepID=L0R6E6_9BACT|nr:hypothetical protein [Maridesulfovibrio hydrothermalis]CCO22279.1 protein of unknown function [Maridesulfovibrio hydrothermalis AM13 = DSM 14728]
MVVEWICQNENYNYQDYENHDFTEVCNFLLMWSYIEHKLISSTDQSNDHPISLSNAIFESKIDNIPTADSNSHVDHAYNFFVERYTSDPPKGNLESLKFQRRHELNFVKRELQRNTNSKNKLKCVAFICTRLRNNLFHGAKQLPNIIEQGALFKHATIGLKGVTIALKVCLDCYKNGSTNRSTDS